MKFPPLTGEGIGLVDREARFKSLPTEQSPNKDSANQRKRHSSANSPMHEKNDFGLAKQIPINNSNLTLNVNRH